MSSRANLKLSFNEVPAQTKSILPEYPDSTTCTTEDGRSIEFRAKELRFISDLGRGAYGVVEKMVHDPSKTEMAVKKIFATSNHTEQKRILMDMDILKKSANCIYTVQFYGTLFQEGEVWLCMEVMDASLDKFYPLVFRKKGFFPEYVLQKIVFAVVKALHYLYVELTVIHRDVKPSNILISKSGEIKLCDFGISGILQNSIAKSVDAGCNLYMAPERINPCGNTCYNIRSDVWSLGISLVELATGKFPYPKWNSIFEHIKQVVNGPAPALPPEGDYSPELRGFTVQCLNKVAGERPTYTVLMDHEFIRTVKAPDLKGWKDVADFVKDILE